MLFPAGTKPQASLRTAGRSTTRPGTRGSPITRSGNVGGEERGKGRQLYLNNNKNKIKKKKRSRNMSWDAGCHHWDWPSPPPPQVRRKQAAPCPEARHGHLPLGLRVWSMKNKDYWCGLQGTQRLSGPHQAPGKELHGTHCQLTVPTVVQVPLGNGLQRRRPSCLLRRKRS